MDAFDMSQIVDGHRRNGELYHEFLRAKRLSVGLYVLEAVATDPQVQKVPARGFQLGAHGIGVGLLGRGQFLNRLDQRQEKAVGMVRL